MIFLLRSRRGPEGTLAARPPKFKDDSYSVSRKRKLRSSNPIRSIGTSSRRTGDNNYPIVVAKGQNEAQILKKSSMKIFKVVAVDY